MAPAPLCKTAIVSYLIDEDTVPKLWNLSSNMRKRIQMILEDMEIRLEEYDDKVLKLKEWVRLGRRANFIKSIEDIKKGVSNYGLETQEQLDKLIALNGKLRCDRMNFMPETPIEIDCIEYLAIYPFTYDFYMSCSFNRIDTLELKGLFTSQIKDVVTKFKKIRKLEIHHSTISKLDLSLFNFSEIWFMEVTLSKEVKLPSHLNRLLLQNCQNVHLINCNRITEIYITHCDLKNSFSWIRSVKGVKQINSNCPLSECINNLPSTVSILEYGIKFDSKNIDLSVVKKKLPFLIRIDAPIPIKAAQTLNLRSIDPIISETEEKFTLRPKKIEIDEKNVQQLNKHPELFEEVEKVATYTYEFNFDCLPSGIKEIRFHRIPDEEEKLDSLKKNNWKYEKAVVVVPDAINKDEIRRILNCLNKVRKVKMHRFSQVLIEEYPQFKFAFNC